MPMTYRESMESMGTFLSVASSEKIPDRAVQAVRQVFQRTEIQCSRFLPFSELSAVNRSAGRCPGLGIWGISGGSEGVTPHGAQNRRRF